MDIFFDKSFLEHNTGQHPESASRLSLILESLDKGRIKKVRNGERYLALVHSGEYVKKVKEACKSNSSLDADTPLSEGSYKAACYAVGAAIDASESNGFALVRPPGHHAFPDRGSGFCIFNNMAIAALYQAEKGRRVFILDIDIHHGNGTEEIVLDREGIKFCSIHQSPLYPGSGLKNRGRNVVNIPLPPGTGDNEYISVLQGRVKRELEEFRPDLVGVSVGFDSYYLDAGTVAGNSFALTTKAYKKVKNVIADYNSFFSLEGGYNPKSILEGVNSIIG